MIRDLKVSYIKDCDTFCGTKVTLTPALGGIESIGCCHLVSIFAQIVKDCGINKKEFLESLAYNLHYQIEAKEEE